MFFREVKWESNHFKNYKIVKIMSRRDREREEYIFNTYARKFSGGTLVILLILALTSKVSSWNAITKTMFFGSVLFALCVFIVSSLCLWDYNHTLSRRERIKEGLTDTFMHGKLRSTRRLLKLRRDKKGNIVNRPIWSSRKNERYFKRKKR